MFLCQENRILAIPYKEKKSLKNTQKIMLWYTETGQPLHYLEVNTDLYGE